MKASIFAFLGLSILAGATTLLQAQESEKRMWRLTVEAAGPVLGYGTDNVEDTPISFSCKKRGGLVNVWINETSRGVRPGRSMTASLTAGSTVSKVHGKTLPNEEAGTPSFLGTKQASDPIFAALSKERLLVFEVGPSRDEVPLQDIADKADRFRRLCEKR